MLKLTTREKEALINNGEDLAFELAHPTGTKVYASYLSEITINEASAIAAARQAVRLALNALKESVQAMEDRIDAERDAQLARDIADEQAEG
jgi:hypothetical protein